MTSHPVHDDIRTYGMDERADYVDFDIRAQQVRSPLSQPHRHEYFQIQLNLGGDTQQMISGHVRPFLRGYLSFVLPYRVHLVPHPVGSRYIIINIAQSFLWPELTVDPLDLEDVSMAQAPTLAPFLFQEHLDFVLDEAELVEVQALLDRISQENAARRFGSLALIKGLTLQLIALVCRKYETAFLQMTAGEARSSRRHGLRRVIRYIGEHLADELTLQDAADAAFLSPNYLAHLLKKETGKTFTELVTERRLIHARKLLAHSSQRIAQVAHASGFADEAYFARRFRQRVGESPSAYRARVRAAASTAA